MDLRIEALLKRVHANRPSEDISLIRKAWEFSIQHHRGQIRASGEPYIIHPLEVAEVLAEMKMDSTAIAAGLLHDSVEDTPATHEELESNFGAQVANIVEGVTNIDKIEFANREDRQAENVRKMLLAMVSDVRVVLIKLADRLHNMRTLEFLKPDRQQAIARETMDIYAPLAHRLGMGKLRGELEDLAFRYIDPVSFEQVSAAVEARRGEGEQFLRGVEDTLVEQLRENGIPARVEWRIKRLYSIFQKIERSKVSFDQVYDFLAIRVITQDVAACYAVFGLIHTLWRPVPGRIKDFIAMPRANHYQSLHTTVMSTTGHQFEVQIRTEEMHRIAEEGIAAHWKYKAGDIAITARDEERLNWIRQLVEWQKEMTDPNEFLSSLKMDLYPDEVYTFTPKGKVVVIPADGTPVDFAYTIHTEVGHTCVGAKVNGRMSPLRAKLRTGDIVEIVTQKDHKPSRDWLTFVKSPRARNKIKHWLNEDRRRRALEIGRKLLEREARRYKVPLSQLNDQDLSHGRRFNGRPGRRQALRPPCAQQTGSRQRQPNGNRGRTGKQARNHGTGHVRRGAQAALDRLRRAEGRRPERSAGLSRTLLQPHPRRRDRRLRYARQGRGCSCAQLSQRGKPALRERPPHQRRVGPPERSHRQAAALPGQDHSFLRRPRGHVEGTDRRSLRR
jgi:GTP pyrophosphokinase